MIALAKRIYKPSKEEVLDLLENGFEGLVVTGAQEEDTEDLSGEKDFPFYDSLMWVNNIHDYGFGKYDHCNIMKVSSGPVEFFYLAFVIK